MYFSEHSTFFKLKTLDTISLYIFKYIYSDINLLTDSVLADNSILLFISNNLTLKLISIRKSAPRIS